MYRYHIPRILYNIIYVYQFAAAVQYIFCANSIRSYLFAVHTVCVVDVAPKAFV